MSKKLCDRGEDDEMGYRWIYSIFISFSWGNYLDRSGALSRAEGHYRPSVFVNLINY